MTIGPAPLSSPAIQSVSSLLRICGLYVILVLSLLGVLHADVVQRALTRPFRGVVAAAASGTLNLLGVAAVSTGANISAPGLSVVIVDECTGLEALILLVPAVLVLPASWRAKGLGIMMSVGVMAAVNFLRVVSLCYVGVYSHRVLQVGHLYIWPVAVIVIGLATLQFWVRKLVVPHS